MTAEPLPFATLYGGARPANAHLAVFARLVNGNGSMFSTQTLPQDDPANPAVVARVLRFVVP